MAKSGKVAVSHTSFSFGQNWQRYLRSMNEERVRIAIASLTGFLRLDSLAGMTLLDIGCGSGLFSCAAYRLGARQIVSIDADPLAIECCRSFHEKAGSPQNWRILEASILDMEFVRQLGSFDVVYAWGVLHHTGRMWDALRNSVQLVSPDGYYYVSIYNKVPGRSGSAMWLRLKKWYNASSLFGKALIESAYITKLLLDHFVRLRNPLKTAREYKSRGMSWRTDIRDWIGGYPYEYASVEEVFHFVRGCCPDLEMVNIETTTGTGCNSFLFHRRTFGSSAMK